MEVPLLIKRLEIYLISSLFCLFKIETRIKCEMLRHEVGDSLLVRFLSVVIRWKSPRIDTIRGFCLVKRLGKLL